MTVARRLVAWVLVLGPALAAAGQAARVVLSDVEMTGVPAVTGTIAGVVPAKSAGDLARPDGYAFAIEVHEVIFGRDLPRRISLAFVPAGYGRAYEFDDRPANEQKVLAYLRRDGGNWVLYRDLPNAISVISDFDCPRVKGLKRINELAGQAQKLTKDDLLTCIATDLPVARQWALAMLARDRLPGGALGAEEVRRRLVEIFTDPRQSFPVIRACDNYLQADEEFRSSQVRWGAYLRWLREGPRRPRDGEDWERFGQVASALLRETPPELLAEERTAGQVFQAYADIARKENSAYGWSASIHLSTLYLRLREQGGAEPHPVCARIEGLLLELLQEKDREQAVEGAAAALHNLAARLAEQQGIAAVPKKVLEAIDDPAAFTRNRDAVAALRSAADQLRKFRPASAPATASAPGAASASATATAAGPR
jgi:hypothetical protein